MPHRQHYSNLTLTELHPTFAAQVDGVDFSKPLSDDVFAEILRAITHYGVIKFPNTGLDDAAHIAFSARFGDLDDISPYKQQGRKHRLDHDQLFDVSNLNDDGSIAALDSHRAAMNRGNSLFHVDSSFNPRRAGYSLLRAHQLPPEDMGGATEFADTRTAYDDLPSKLKQELHDNDYVACHSLYHSRKTASPESLPDINPEDHFMSRHRLIQRHTPSNRTNIYIASHAHHIENVPREKSTEILSTLYKHATQQKYIVSIPWTNNTDLILWDNTCVMHRATGGSFEGKYVRDMRRTTAHDMSEFAWGLNERGDSQRMGYP